MEIYRMFCFYRMLCFLFVTVLKLFVLQQQNQKISVSYYNLYSNDKIRRFGNHITHGRETQVLWKADRERN